MITLFPYQQKLVDQKRKKMILFHSTGVGKTISSLAMMYAHRPSCFIVVCPKRVQTKWEVDIKRYEETVGYTIPHKVVTKEYFKTIPVYKLSSVKSVILDEAHNYTSTSSQIQKSISNYIKLVKPDIVYALTATPYRSSPWNIYYLIKFVGGYIDYKLFKKICFDTVSTYSGDFTAPSNSKECKDYLSLIMQPYTDSLNMNEVMDVPKSHHEIIEIPLPKEWREYEACDDQLVISWITEMHQVEQRSTKKIEEILNIYSQHKSCAVVCRYTEQIEMYKNVLTGKNILFTCIDGKSKQNIQLAQDVLTDGGIVLIQSDVAEGYELPQTNCMIFASQSYSYVNWKQACGRIQRINNLQECFYYYLMCQGGIDEEIYNSVIAKSDFDYRIYLKKLSTL